MLQDKGNAGIRVMFADDMLILANSKENLQYKLNILNGKQSKINMVITDAKKKN